ncbi:MAG: EAL domain-containing protein [Gammaproteobacteria bacterium]|nr:EAL domain-containing protein [Gammaproteobacteria bacterium]
MTEPRMIVLDDEVDIAEFIQDVAVDVGFDAIAIHRADDFERLYSDSIDVVVLDLVMPDRDGIELLRFLADRCSSSKIILISGYDVGVLHSAQKLASEQGLDVVETLSKPIRYDALRQLLSSLPLSAESRPKQSIELLELPTEDELLRALSADELVVYYQPQMALSSGALIGVEALVRWNHPERGLLMPNFIIPLAEETGLMDRLTSKVMEQSFRQASLWLQAGFKIHVSINMAPCNFKHLDLPEWITEKLQEHGLSPDQIALEVTETTLMEELVKSLDILTRLRMKGMELSIDDFGTGYSSLVQLHRIPFSELKIDRSFVMKAATDQEAMAIVEMTILLGHKLGMSVVAEGVETHELWNLLVNLGCDVGQGYFISRPMPGNQLIDWHGSWKKPLTINE